MRNAAVVVNLPARRTRGRNLAATKIGGGGTGGRQVTHQPKCKRARKHYCGLRSTGAGRRRVSQVRRHYRRDSLEGRDSSAWLESRWIRGQTCIGRSATGADGWMIGAGHAVHEPMSVLAQDLKRTGVPDGPEKPARHYLSDTAVNCGRPNLHTRDERAAHLRRTEAEGVPSDSARHQLSFKVRSDGAGAKQARRHGRMRPRRRRPVQPTRLVQPDEK